MIRPERRAGLPHFFCYGTIEHSRAAFWLSTVVWSALPSKQVEASGQTCLLENDRSLHTTLMFYNNL